MNKKCFISIWFSNFSVDLILMEDPKLKDKPFCILKTHKHRKIIFKVNHKCRSSKLIEGWELSDATIVEPNLIIQKDPSLGKKKFLLNKILYFLSRITPEISIAKDSTLLMNIPNIVKESAIKEIETFLKNSDITAQIGIANTIGAAWAKSHFQKENNLKNSIHSSITNLPVTSLRISYDSIKKLNNVGIETIAQLEKVPKNELSLRFDREVSSFFDKATGKEIEPIATVKIEPSFQMRVNLCESPNCKYQVISLTKKLIVALCIKLKNANVGAQDIDIIFNHETNLKKVITVRLAEPSNSHTRIVTIFASKLLGQENISQVHNIHVAISKTYPIIYEQKEFLDSNITKEDPSTFLKRGDSNILKLVEKLENRLGRGSVKVFSPQENHIPEKSYIFRSPAYEPQIENWIIQKKVRPKILFEPQPIIMLEQSPKLDSNKPPRLFYWSGKKYEIFEVIGPERISLNWWLVKKNYTDAERDYWQVKSTCGSHLWLFNLKHKTDLNISENKWLIQGQFC